ncbi:pyridoxal phosphate-dependent aminotransferase [Rhodobacteraceae bacterium NNCM2]|nr:pyridoxal phosphate-dependent aminotransferase [Coraliihabitans acroporae]
MTPPMNRFTKLVASLPATIPFVAPEETERLRGRPFAARIGANENVFGPSPKAVEAMALAAAESWQYGDPTSHDLCNALAAFHGIPAEAIRIGEGIDGLLGLAVRLLIEPQDTVVTSKGAYPTFNYHVAGFGGVLHAVPYSGDHEDPVALAEAAREHRARMVYLANPDNPMGTWQKPAFLREMLDALPEDCTLVLDEAYIEFAPEGVEPEISLDDPRVLRFRTFSKARGMAGLRIGYVIGAPDVVAGLDRIRNHFGVSRVAQAGALASLADDAHLALVRRQADESKARIDAIARGNGLSTLPSATNFVAVDCGRDGAFAKRIMEELGNRDVFVRMPGVEPLSRCIRVSCGREAEMSLLETTLPQAIQAVSRA